MRYSLITDNPTQSISLSSLLVGHVLHSIISHFVPPVCVCLCVHVLCVSFFIKMKECRIYTAPQHLVCRVVQSLHTNHMQMSIVEVFICRRLHMSTSMIPVCIWLICRLCTALHTKCCGAVISGAGKGGLLADQCG